MAPSAESYGENRSFSTMADGCTWLLPGNAYGAKLIDYVGVNRLRSQTVIMDSCGEVGEFSDSRVNQF